MAGNSLRQKRMDAGDSIFTRRDSIAVAGAEFQQELQERLSELRSIWNEVGMTEDQRRERMDTALNHLKTLLAEMVEEESCMRETLHNSLLVTKKEIESLLKQLHHPKPAFLQDSEGKLTLLELNEKCTALRDELAHERDTRIRERDRLLCEFSRYAVRLDVPDSKFDVSVVPDMHSLEKLKEDVDRIKKEWETNFTTFQDRRPTIAKLASKISLDGFDLTQFQRQVLAHDVKHDMTVVLSRKNMHELADLENLLQDKYNAFLEEIRERIGVVQFELTKWWDQCHIPTAERERFRTVDPEVDPERAVEQYNEAIAHYRAFYESRKTILDKIGEWERLWQESVEFEERELDPNRYKNRGGALLQEEKRRKKVLALLPQVYKQLSTLVSEYDLAHPDEAFAMDGMLVMDYIDSIERDYQEKKRKEKEEKEMMKKQQLMVERMYGAVPNTPGSQRKRVGMASTVTPSKQTSPSKKGATSASSKPYIHSSLAARSPIANKTATAPSAPGSSTKKPPSGLPVRAQPVKRKVLMENQGDLEHQASMAGGSADDHVSVSSTGSYGEFAKILRARGGEIQSSFIGPHTQSPSKMARKE